MWVKSHTWQKLAPSEQFTGWLIDGSQHVLDISLWILIFCLNRQMVVVFIYRRRNVIEWEKCQKLIFLECIGGKFYLNDHKNTYFDS